jgi:hypothetical protein
MTTIEKIRKARKLILEANAIMLNASENFPLNGESINNGIIDRHDQEAFMRNDMIDIYYTSGSAYLSRLDDEIKMLERPNHQIRLTQRLRKASSIKA